MKKFAILPGAAGIIALTATIGFVDGQREVETESFSREKISLVGNQQSDANPTGLSGDMISGSRDSAAYLVEFKHGDKIGHVLIDAATGKVILS